MDGTGHADTRHTDRSAEPRPRVTYALIGCCCLVFLAGPASGLLPSHGTGQALEEVRAACFRRWGVVPSTLFSGALRPLATPLTALFLHANWLHLLGNLLFLFVFG
ncbi:hypothetical protein AN219_01105, partial [Streptomyces nanshensis]